MIDLAPMKGIRVDPARRTIWAQGGVTWKDSIGLRLVTGGGAPPLAGGLQHRHLRADPGRREAG